MQLYRSEAILVFFMSLLSSSSSFNCRCGGIVVVIFCDAVIAVGLAAG